MLLFWVIFWAGLFVFVAVMAALVYIAVKYRARPGDGDPEQIHGNKTLEIAWSIAPALVLIVGRPLDDIHDLRQRELSQASRRGRTRRGGHRPPVVVRVPIP